MEDRHQTLLGVSPPVAAVFAPDSYGVSTCPVNDLCIALEGSLNTEVIGELCVFEVLKDEGGVKD